MSNGPVPVGRPRRALLFVFIYIILLFHISGYVGNEMATATFSVSMAIVEEGRLTIDSYIEGARELAYHNGHFYSGMPPGQSFIALPLYFVLRPAISAAADVITPRLQHLEWAAKYGLDQEFGVRRLLLLILFTALLSAPCAAATCVMLVDLAQALGQRPGVLGTFLLPLCTIWWTYGTEYGPRIMGGFLLLVPIWWVYVRRETATDRRRMVMAAAVGAGLAMVPLLRYELVFPAVFIGLWLLFHLNLRRAIVFLVAAGIITAAGMAYHAHCYGGPLDVAYSKKLWPANALPRKHRNDLDRMTAVTYEGEKWVVWNQEQMIGVTPDVIAEGLWANPEALLRFSPFLVLAPIGLALMLRSRPVRGPALLLTGLVAVSFVILVLLPHPGFRGAIGPRYLLWVLPTLILLTLPAWQRLPGFARCILFVASFIPSYFAAMLASHATNAWSLWQLADFGLTNYTLSRAQLAGASITPAISSCIVLGFWAIVAIVFLRPGSRWYVFGGESVSEDGREAS